MTRNSDFSNFLKIIEYGWMIILVTTFLGGVLSAYVTLELITPKYEASSKVLINKKAGNNGNYYNDLQADVEMITSYKDLITDSSIIKPVSNKLLNKYGEKIATTELQNDITIDSSQGSRVMKINAVTTSPILSEEIVNEASRVFKVKVEGLTKVKNILIISKATHNNMPITPNRSINLTVGIFLGMFIGIAISALRYLNNSKIQNTVFLSGIDLKVLGCVGHEHNS